MKAVLLTVKQAAAVATGQCHNVCFVLMSVLQARLEFDVRGRLAPQEVIIQSSCQVPPNTVSCVHDCRNELVHVNISQVNSMQYTLRDILAVGAGPAKV
jgi:hypothetical protein